MVPNERIRDMKTELVDGKLILTIDVSDEAKAKAPLSASGKARMFASTGGAGFTDICGFGVKLVVCQRVKA